MYHQPLPVRQQVIRITKVPQLQQAQDNILCLMRRQWAVISVASQRTFLERLQDRDNNPLHPVL
jgi:hypothetical protein